MFLEWYQILALISATPGVLLLLYLSFPISLFIFEVFTSGEADGLSSIGAIVYFLLIVIGFLVFGSIFFFWGFWPVIYSFVVLELLIIIFIIKK